MLTAMSLFQQYQSSWSDLSPRQRAAFRGNVTWLLARTNHDGDRAVLTTLREMIQPSRPAATPRPAPRTYAISTTTLQLRRRTLRLADVPGIGASISTPDNAAAIARRLIGDQPQEHLLLLLLDAQWRVTGVHTLHIGTTSECQVSAGDILRVALLANAPFVMLAHNHPSGEPTPSDADLISTRNIVAAGQLVGVRVLDHLIVTDDAARFTSLARREPDIFSRAYQWQ